MPGTQCRLVWPVSVRTWSEGTRTLGCSKLLEGENKLLISKTSRFYIGLAVGLPVFSNISIILTHVQTVLSLQGKATSRNWLNR